MKVRIKKTPRTGDQRDYSLTTHRPWSPSNTEGPDAVRNTIGAVPRNQANIEAEGGETILGDINNDGNIEHMTITGKRHTQGGVPLNVPPGSFIFSDTKRMKIKDQEVLDYFGMGKKKGGYTPAEIAKRYQLNEFMKKVNDPSADSFTRRTAERMLNNNMQKLAELAAYQEGMKGKESPAVSQQMLPDGGQQFNESAQPQMDPSMMDPAMLEQLMMMQGQGADMEELEMAYGGFIEQMQTGGRVGDRFYINNQQNKVSKRYKGFFGDEWIVFEKPIKVYDEDGNVDELEELTVEDFNKLTKGKLAVGYNDNAITPNKYTDINNLGWWGQDRSITDIGRGVKPTTLNFSTKPTNAKYDAFGNSVTPQANHLRKGFEYTVGNKRYKVIDPNVYSTYGSNNGNRAAVRVQQISDPDRNIGSYMDTKFGEELIYLDDFNKMFKYNPAANGKQQQQIVGATRVVYDAKGTPKTIGFNEQTPAGYFTSKPKTNVQKTAPAVQRTHSNHVSNTPTSLPKQQSKVKVYESVDDLYNDKWQELQDKAMGGQLYAEGGVTEPPKYKYDPVQRKMIPIMQTAGTTPGDEKEFVEEYEIKGQGKHKRITKGNNIKIIGPDGKVVKEGKIENDYDTYSAQDIDNWKKNNIDVTLPTILNDKYESDKTEGRQGIRTDAKGVYGTQNYWNPENAADFKKRHARFVAANPNFDPEKDSGAFQTWYNKDVYDQAIAAGYSPEEATGYVNKFGFVAGSKNPNAQDSKFGRYTWSRPTINIGKKPPGPITVYRCPDCQPVQVPGDYKMAEGDYDSQSVCKTMCAEKSTPPPGKNPPDNDFWIQNKLGIANAAMMDRFYGEPALFQMNGALYDPQLEEYSAKNAALQSDASLAMSNINASADPTTARANIAAIAGQLGQTGVNQIADIQNRNVQTTNAVAADRARLKNDFIGKNTAMRKQFYDETMNYGQNLVNSSNKQRTMMTNAFNNAFQGLQNRNMFRAIYPMYDINSVTGAHAFIDGQDFTEGGFKTSPDETGGSLPALIEHYKKQFTGVLTPENAEKQAMALANKHLEASNASRLATQRAYLQQNPQAAMAGMSGGYTPFE